MEVSIFGSGEESGPWGKALPFVDQPANGTYVRRMFSEAIRLDPVRRSERELRLIGDRVSRLGNAGNYRCRQAFLAKEGVPTGFMFVFLERLFADGAYSGTETAAA